MYMYANLMQVCTAINREFLFLEAKKKKNGTGVWNSMLILLPCASDGVEEVDIATNLILLHKVLRFRTMYLQFFHALSFVATVHGL